MGREMLGLLCGSHEVQEGGQWRTDILPLFSAGDFPTPNMGTGGTGFPVEGKARLSLGLGLVVVWESLEFVPATSFPSPGGSGHG